VSQRDEASLIEYLEHIHQAISRIQTYITHIDQSAFIGNLEKQDAVIRNLEVIGEAAGNIQRHFPGFAETNPAIPLKAAYGTRNALAHGYFKVDLQVVWKTVERDLPLLLTQITDAITLLEQNKSKT